VQQTTAQVSYDNLTVEEIADFAQSVEKRFGKQLPEEKVLR
jgi:hypothetical protein